MNDTQQELLAAAREHHEQISESLILLKSLRQTLAELLKRVRQGEASALKDLSKKHGELETALKAARDIERRFNEWHDKFTGRLAHDEIDFEAVREDIRRRLARLAE